MGPRALGSGARGGGLVDVAGGPRAREAERAKGSGGERCSSGARVWRMGELGAGTLLGCCGPAELVQTRRRNIRIPAPIHYPPIAAMNSRACVGASGAKS